MHVDLTRQQVARNGVAWKVRTPKGNGSSERLEGVAEAEFGEGGVKVFRLGAGT